MGLETRDKVSRKSALTEVFSFERAVVPSKRAPFTIVERVNVQALPLCVLGFSLVFVLCEFDQESQLKGDIYLKHQRKSRRVEVKGLEFLWFVREMRTLDWNVGHAVTPEIDLVLSVSSSLFSDHAPWFLSA